MYFLHRTTHRRSITLEPSYVLPYCVVSPRWLILNDRDRCIPRGWKRDKEKEKERRKDKKKKKEKKKPVTVYFARLFSPRFVCEQIGDIWPPRWARQFKWYHLSPASAGAAFHSDIRNFCIWRIGDYYHSISLRLPSFASYRLPCVFRFTYDHGHREYSRMSICIFLFLLSHSFSFILVIVARTIVLDAQSRW